MWKVNMREFLLMLLAGLLVWLADRSQLDFPLLLRQIAFYVDGKTF